MPTATLLAFAISLAVQVFYPLAATLVFRRRTHASWRLWGYGALVFAVFQLFSWLPISVYADAVLGARLQSGWAGFLWLLAVAFTTALVEESGRWLGYRHLFPRRGFKLVWRNGVMFGLGHGSLETMLFIGGLTFVYLIAYLALHGLGADTLLGPASASSAELQAAAQEILNTTWSQPLVVALERVLALPHQVAWALLVMQSHVSRQKRWFGLAVAYHLSIAVIVPGLARLAGFTLAEGVNLLFAMLSVWLILKLRAVSAEAYTQPLPAQA